MQSASLNKLIYQSNTIYAVALAKRDINNHNKIRLTIVNYKKNGSFLQYIRLSIISSMWKVLINCTQKNIFIDT